jgi:hypothetical protein
MSRTFGLSLAFRTFQAIPNFGLKRICNGRPFTETILAILDDIPLVLQKLLRNTCFHWNIHTLVVLEFIVQVVQNQREQFVRILPAITL